MLKVLIYIHLKWRDCNTEHIYVKKDIILNKMFVLSLALSKKKIMSK
jgi:hypothetical protein